MNSSPVRTKDLHNSRILLDHIVQLQDANNHAVGFITRSALSEYHTRAQIIPATQTNQLLAYAIYFAELNAKPPKPDPNTRPVTQQCMHYDARRFKHATSLVNHLITQAEQNSCTHIRAWIAHDLPANHFPHALGFTKHATTFGRGPRQRTHNLWILEVDPSPTAPTRAQRDKTIHNLIHTFHICPKPQHTQPATRVAPLFLPRNLNPTPQR